MAFSAKTLFDELARIRVQVMRRRRAGRAEMRVRGQAAAIADERRCQVAMLHEARIALIKAGLSREAATIALTAIDHHQVPYVSIDYTLSCG